ncbi:MAG: InlB B-repeat-containing protein [Acidobacteriota bacterium]|nr:InlB B-repeat-containing protein [Acidobacteriota bacterium]
MGIPEGTPPQEAIICGLSTTYLGDHYEDYPCNGNFFQIQEGILYGEVSFSLTAKKEHSIIVHSGSASIGGRDILKCLKDVSVTLTASSSHEGKNFEKWEIISGGVALEDVNSPSTTFIMQDEDVEISAVYESTTTEYAVNVTGGVASVDGTEVTSAREGDTVDLTAGEAPEGQRFAAWRVLSGGASLAEPRAAQTSFAMPAADVEVRAEWADEGQHDVLVEGGKADNGTGSELFVAREGETVWLRAGEAPAGRRFAGWEVVSGGARLQDHYNGRTSFTMPGGAVRVRAVWAGEGEYAIIVNADAGCEVRVVAIDHKENGEDEDGGTPVGSGSTVPHGTVLSVTATAKPGHELVTVPDASYTVNRDLVIVAESRPLEYALTTTVEPVEGGEQATHDPGNPVSYGTGVTVTAGTASEGYEFLGWCQTNGKILTTDATYTHRVTADLELQARYRRASGAVTFVANDIVVASIDDTADISDDDYPADPTPCYGFEFVGWDKGAAEVNEALAGGGSVTVTARFRPVERQITVTVYNGESEGATTESFDRSQYVRVKAAHVLGRSFACWVQDGVVMSYQEEILFRATADTTLRAVYTSSPVEATGVATIRAATYDWSASRLTFVAHLTVPEGATIDAAGLVAADSTSATVDHDQELSLDNADYKKASAKAVGTAGPVTYTWTKGSVSAGAAWDARPYVTYTLGGETRTVYGEQVRVTAGDDYDSGERATATIFSGSYDGSAKKAQFVAYLTVPEGGTIVKAGLVASPGTSYDPGQGALTLANAQYRKSSAKAVGTGGPVTYTWVKTKVEAGDVWYVRPYVTYTDPDGTERTVYGATSRLAATGG